VHYSCNFGSTESKPSSNWQINYAAFDWISKESRLWYWHCFRPTALAANWAIGAAVPQLRCLSICALNCWLTSGSPMVMPCGWWHHSHGILEGCAGCNGVFLYENVRLAQEVTGGLHFPDICLSCHHSCWHKSHKSRCVDYAIFMFAFAAAGEKTTSESKRMWHALPLTTMRYNVRRESNKITQKKSNSKEC